MNRRIEYLYDREHTIGHAYFKEFKQTEAYSQLIIELATDSKAATEFVNGIVPANMAKQAELAAKN